MSEALERAGRDNRVRKKKAAAPDRLRDVAASLDLAGSDITMSLASRTFDPEEIDEALGAVRASLRKIAPLLGRANAQGKNVQWLIDSLAREES